MEVKGPIIIMETFFVSNHNFACTKERPRIAQLGLWIHYLKLEDKNGLSRATLEISSEFSSFFPLESQVVFIWSIFDFGLVL